MSETTAKSSPSFTDRVLMLLSFLRARIVSKTATLVWFAFHWPYVRFQPRSSVALSVKVRPFWNFGRRLSVKLDRNVTLYPGVLIQGSGTLHIGERSFIMPMSVIGVNDRVVIGQDCLIAHAVSIRDSDHAFESTDRPINRQGIVSAPVTIGNDVWIGHGATILKGVAVGDGAIVAAGAVVRANVPPMSIVGGVPARVLGRRPGAGSELTGHPTTR